MPFRDRVDAGHRLGAVLEPWRAIHPVVLGLPRGGVPVAAEVAAMLNAPLDVILVRKLGLPTQPELAMGAIGEDEIRVLNDDVLRMAQLEPATVAAVESAARFQLDALAQRFRGSRSRVDVRDRTVIIVDDGIATGSTARAAIEVARAHGAARVVLAVPVAPGRTCAELGTVADEVVCIEQPNPFTAVGQFYRDFSQTTDAEVIACLSGE